MESGDLGRPEREISWDRWASWNLSDHITNVAIFSAHSAGPAVSMWLKLPPCITPAASAAVWQPHLEGDQLLGHLSFVLPALPSVAGTF